jgi:hypothetical protein
LRYQYYWFLNNQFLSKCHVEVKGPEPDGKARQKNRS